MKKLMKTVAILACTMIASLLATSLPANAAEPSHRVVGFGQATSVPTNLVGGLVFHTVSCQIVAAGPRLAELRMTECSINGNNVVPSAGVLGVPDVTGASVATFNSVQTDYYTAMHVCWHGVASFVAFLDIPAEVVQVDGCSDI